MLPFSCSWTPEWRATLAWFLAWISPTGVTTQATFNVLHPVPQKPKRNGPDRCLAQLRREAEGIRFVLWLKLEQVWRRFSYRGCSAASYCQFQLLVQYNTFYGPIPPPLFCKCTVPQKISESYHSFPPCRHIFPILPLAKKYSYIPQEKKSKNLCILIKNNYTYPSTRVTPPTPHKNLQEIATFTVAYCPSPLLFGFPHGSSHKQNVYVLTASSRPLPPAHSIMYLYSTDCIYRRQSEGMLLLKKALNLSSGRFKDD